MDIRIVEVVDYNAQWQEQYLAEEKILRGVLKDVLVEIHHIGSTSVEGLCAKPIIDILLEVTDLEQLDLCSDDMKRSGYLVKGEFGIKGRRYFQKGGIQRSHQVHAFKLGDENIERHIAFRDYLRANPKVKAEYGETKKRAAEHCDNDIEMYMGLKNDFIEYNEARALKWKNKMTGDKS